MVERNKPKRTPNREDKHRIAEAIFNLDMKGNIQDRDSFDLDYDAYFDTNDYWVDSGTLREEIFKEVRKINPDISTEHLFKKAKGKDLKRDRQQTARTVVTDIKDYKDARQVDLKGYDTKTQKKIFDLIGKSKGRTVFARKTSVIVQGKRRLRYRDNKGRFVSVKG